MKLRTHPEGYALRADGPYSLLVVAEGVPPLIRPTHLGLSGMSAVLEETSTLAIGDRRRFCFHTPHGERVTELQGTVRRVAYDTTSTHMQVGVEFGEVTIDSGRKLLAAIDAHLRQTPRRPANGVADTEVIDDPVRVDQILRSLFASRCSARIRALGPRPGAEVLARARRIAPDAELPLEWSVERRWPRPPFEMQTFGYNSGFAFLIEQAEARDDLLLAGRPKALIRARGQRHRRMRAPPAARVSFRHPLFPQVAIHRPIRDVSFEGLSFVTDLVVDAMYPGLELPSVEVIWPGGVRIRMGGAVRHISNVGHEPYAACGIHLRPLTSGGGATWMELVSRLLYPNTIAATTAHDQLWDLFVRSGYLHIAGKEADAFAAMRGAFANTNRRLRRAPELGSQICWPSKSRIEGSVTLIKPYAHTWLGFQLARRRDGVPPVPGRRILREVLFHGYEYPQRDPDFHWMVTWVRTDGIFSRHLMYDLTQRFVDDPTRADIVRFRAMRGRCDRPGAPPGAGIDIGSPRGDDMPRLLAAIRDGRSPAYVEAHDLVASRFDLGAMKGAWERAGLARDRVTLIARHNGRACAAAVCELVEEGLHLFGLFDVVRLFAITPGGRATFTALLEAARDWYASRGKSGFAYFCETEDYEHALVADLEDLGTADMTILSAELMPDQLEHAWEITAPKEAS